MRLLTFFILLSAGAAAQDPMRTAQDDLLRADTALSFSRDERVRVQTYLQTVDEREKRLAKELAEARSTLRNLLHEQEALEARIHSARERIVLLAERLSVLHEALYRARCRCREIEKRCRDTKNEEEGDACRRDRAAAREALARLEEEERRVSALLATEELERARCERIWALLEERRPELEDRVADLGRAREARAREREKAKRDLSDLETEILANEDQQAEAMTRLGDVRLAKEAPQEPSAHPPLGAALSPEGRGGGVPATSKEMGPQRPIQETEAPIDVTVVGLVDADGDGRFPPGEEAHVELHLSRLTGRRLTSILAVVEGAATVLVAREDLAPSPAGIAVAGRIRIRPEARPGSRIAVHVSLVEGKSCVFSRLLFAKVAAPAR